VRFPEGDTSAANLRPECTRHHHVKHSPGVTVETTPDHGTRWTMPTGHSYEIRPPPAALVWDDTWPDHPSPAELARDEPWWSDWTEDVVRAGTTASAGCD
jgi:hypothetical protein